MSRLEGVPVPTIASNAELKEFVERIYEACGCNYTEAARAIGVHGASVRNLICGYQWDSPSIREALGINKTKPRPRVWMPTNNCEGAVRKLLEKYEPVEVYKILIDIAQEEPGVVLRIYRDNYNVSLRDWNDC